MNTQNSISYEDQELILSKIQNLHEDEFDIVGESISKKIIVNISEGKRLNFTHVVGGDNFDITPYVNEIVTTTGVLVQTIWFIYFLFDRQKEKKEKIQRNAIMFELVELLKKNNEAFDAEKLDLLQSIEEIVDIKLEEIDNGEIN